MLTLPLAWGIGEGGTRAIEQIKVFVFCLCRNNQKYTHWLDYLFFYFIFLLLLLQSPITNFLLLTTLLLNSRPVRPRPLSPYLTSPSLFFFFFFFFFSLLRTHPLSLFLFLSFFPLLISSGRRGRGGGREWGAKPWKRVNIVKS